MTSPKHIGIAACSAEGAALCYRTICAEAPALLGAHRHPEISMHTPSLAGYVACLEAGDMAGVADLMLASAEKLAACGADFVICPDNTIHQAMDLVRPRSPLPWLHIADAVGDAAQADGYRKLALLGTKWLVESDVYPNALSARGIAFVRPSTEEREAMNAVIMDDLVPGILSDEATAFLVTLIDRMRDEETCDAAILGCTEIPLVINEENAGLPVLDSTRLIARAALAEALTA